MDVDQESLPLWPAIARQIVGSSPWGVDKMVAVKVRCFPSAEEGSLWAGWVGTWWDWLGAHPSLRFIPDTAGCQELRLLLAVPGV